MFAVLAIALGAISADAGNPQFTAGTNAFKSKLIGYDAERNLIRLTRGMTSVTLIVDKNVKITVDHEASERKLSDVPANTNIGVVVNADKTTLLELHVLGPEVMRTIESVDLDKCALRTLAGKKEETLALSKGVMVTKGKDEASLEDIKPGTRVSLQLSFDKSKVLTIRLLPPTKKKN
jgi:hypothetical protein